MQIFSKRFLLGDSCIFNGLTDYHAHLLPGGNDGTSTMEEALEVLSCFERQGVRRVWLTPRIMEDMPNATLHLQARFEELKAAYTGTIELRLAAEYMLDNLFRKRLAENDLLPLKDNYLLVETCCFSPPMDMDGILKRVMAGGYFPVLAHPERYIYMTMKDFYRLRTIGVHFQLNLPSIAGVYGRGIQITAEKLLQKNLYDFIGTGTHSLSHFRYINNTKISKSNANRLRVLAVLQQYNHFGIQNDGDLLQLSEIDKHDKR